MSNLFMHTENARVKEQAEQMKNIERAGICPFCRKHFEENHKAPILWESKYWLLTKNDYPYEGAQIHLLIVSKRHIEHVTDVSFRASMNLFLLLRWTCNKFSIRGGSFLMRFGNMHYTGATIAHLHAHIIVGVKKNKNTNPLRAKIGYANKTPSE